VIDGHIITDFGGLTDDHTHAVVDKEPLPDLCTGMDFDAGKEAHQLSIDACQQFKPVFPQPM